MKNKKTPLLNFIKYYGPIILLIILILIFFIAPIIFS